MKRVRGRMALVAVASALAFSLSGGAFAQPYRSLEQISLPEGTVLRAELNDPLSSVSSRPGDRFTGRILSDAWGLPSGTEVVGYVADVQRANNRHPGIVDVDFRTLRLRDGRTSPIEGELISLDSSHVQRTSSGRLEARGRNSRNKYQFLGYGAGAGAVISVFTGGSVLKGALLGALAGYAYQQLNRDKLGNGRYADVNLKPGTPFGVVLNRGSVVELAEHPYARYAPYARSGPRTAGSFQRYPNSGIRVLIDGREVSFAEATPFIVRDHVMLPLDPVLAALGDDYNYDPRSREVTIDRHPGETRFSVGDNFAVVDGRSVRLEEPVQRIDGTLYVPSDLLETATDVRADWDAESRVLRLETGTVARSAP